MIPNGFDLENLEGISIHEKVSSNGKLDLCNCRDGMAEKGHHNVYKALPELLKEFRIEI
ncbi:MAG: hypothetical protein R3A12_19005 [Ignavibacteria bacterium]